jgi:hypothetical protein
MVSTNHLTRLEVTTAVNHRKEHLVHLLLAQVLADDRRRELRQTVAAAHRTPARRGAVAAAAPADESVIIRFAKECDRRALEALAQLESRRPMIGRTLVAETPAGLVAAVPVDGDDVLSDPFRPADGLVELLRLRAAQLSGRRLAA